MDHEFIDIVLCCFGIGDQHGSKRHVNRINVFSKLTLQLLAEDRVTNTIELSGKHRSGITADVLVWLIHAKGRVFGCARSLGRDTLADVLINKFVITVQIINSHIFITKETYNLL
jgi:hypothetical protein